MKNVAWGKFIVALAATGYFLWAAHTPAQWHFIDNVNLLVHESGHIIFLPFGEFFHFLGGSLAQILLPALFAFYFFRQRQYFSAALVLFWVGESLLNVSVYAADALKMQLPLLSGDSSVHDWNWLLIYTGQLRHTVFISQGIRFTGILITILAAIWSFWSALRNE